MNLKTDFEIINQPTKQNPNRTYHRFLSVLKEPLDKDQKNSMKKELWDVLNEIKYQASDALVPFMLVSFFFLIFLLLILPNGSWVIILLGPLLISYFIFFVISIAKPVFTAIFNTFKPWNEFIFNEILSREPRPNTEITAIKDRLITEFSISQLIIIQKLASRDFETNNDKLKDIVEISTKCVVIFTVVAAITKEFADITPINVLIILIYGFIVGSLSIAMLLYRLIREMKFKKMLASIEQAITYLESIEDTFDDIKRHNGIKKDESSTNE